MLNLLNQFHFFYLMIWVFWVMIWIISAFFIASYVKIFRDYGSNYFLILSLLFLFFSFEIFAVWLFGWFFLWIAFYKKTKMGVD